MEHYLQELQCNVKSRLTLIRDDSRPVGERAREAIGFLEETYQQLKKSVTDCSFSSPDEEIRFFKHVKPRIVSYLIYSLKVYGLEVNRPAGSDQAQADYLRRELEGIRIYFERNADLYRYYRSGDTYLDGFYFRRGADHDAGPLPESFYLERDPMFSTACDFKFSKIMGYELWEEYLKGKLRRMEQAPPAAGPGLVDAEERHRWTASKNDLIELIYALDEDACIDNGKISLAQLTILFERMFHIELGNVSRSFNDMRIRNRPTPFLERLIRNLLQRMKRE